MFRGKNLFNPLGGYIHLLDLVDVMRLDWDEEEAVFDGLHPDAGFHLLEVWLSIVVQKFYTIRWHPDTPSSHFKHFIYNQTIRNEEFPRIGGYHRLDDIAESFF